MDKSLEVTQQDEVPAEMNFYRIEALRCASRVIAGLSISAASNHKGYVPTLTVEYAEQFAKWLETGER